MQANFHRVRYPRPGEYKVTLHCHHWICRHAIMQSDLLNLQGERQSIAYFANARVSTVFQGPIKRYPPITFAQIMEQKRGKDLPVNPEQLDPVEYLRSDMQTLPPCSRI